MGFKEIAEVIFGALVMIQLRSVLKDQQGIVIQSVQTVLIILGLFAEERFQLAVVIHQLQIIV